MHQRSILLTPLYPKDMKQWSPPKQICCAKRGKSKAFVLSGVQATSWYHGRVMDLGNINKDIVINYTELKEKLGDSQIHS